MISTLLISLTSVAFGYDFEGTYYGESGIDKLEITKNSVHIYGKCTPDPCDWGNATKINYYSDKNMIVAEFRPFGDNQQKVYNTIIIAPTAQKNIISVSSVTYWNTDFKITDDKMNVMTYQEYVTKKN